MKRNPHNEVYWTEEQQKAHLSAVRSNELLAASNQAIEALFKAKNTIHAFHGEVAWDIYKNNSPEMRQINSAINRLGKAIIFSGGGTYD